MRKTEIDCPRCKKKRWFHLSPYTGIWRCWVCSYELVPPKEEQ